MSELEIKGTSERVLGDITINSYHPYVAFNLTPADAPLRPYILIGFGATTYGSVEFTGVGGVQRETESETQYSGTFGAGLKIFANNIGARLGVQWTPTYIKTDSAGYWCDPCWGCYVVGDARSSNQFQLNGGITFSSDDGRARAAAIHAAGSRRRLGPVMAAVSLAAPRVWPAARTSGRAARSCARPGRPRSSATSSGRRAR